MASDYSKTSLDQLMAIVANVADYGVQAEEERDALAELYARFKVGSVVEKTVPVDGMKRVRIAVAIDDTGTWCAQGQSIESGVPYPDDEMAAEVLDDPCLTTNASKMVHFVEADIPVPQSMTVKGSISGC